MSAADKKEVFISYNGNNKDLAEYLCNMLEGAGVSCWIAPRDVEPAKQWAESIVEGLNNCNVMALLVSSTSLASQEVAKEVSLANTAKKEILPIRVEDVQLSGPLEYHLATRQWVDAINGEKLGRFQAAVNAILRMLNKSAESSMSDFSIMGQARAAVERLNQKHVKQLDATNAMFSARGSEDAKVSIFYPQRIGATGVDLISEFDCKNKSVRIYANAASDGDPLKDPFGKLIENKYKETRLPKFSWKERGRRWEFITLMPETELTTPLLGENAESSFPRFAGHVEALSSSLITDLLIWSVYAKDVSDAFDRLEVELKKVFPNCGNDKWQVGASEGGRINGFKAGGKINVFKRAWIPKQDDYLGRGNLSITLEAGGHFLQNLKIGILKYENWFDLGEFDKRILEEGKVRLGASVNSSEFYPLEFRLHEEWQDCGLISGEPKWQGKLNGFVAYVVECFTKLKDLEPLLDEACAALPTLQDKDLATILGSNREWWSSALYTRNRLRLLAERIKARNSSDKINVEFRYRHREECPPSELFLAVKVGNFDTAVAYRFTFHWLDTVVTSLEPPHFEDPIVKAFLQKHHPSLLFASVKGNTVCNGKSLSEWIDQFEVMVEENIDSYLSAMVHLVDHLEHCREFSEFIAKALRASLPETEHWIIKNHAANSLETGNGISIHRSSWLAPSHNEGEPAPLLVLIVPNKSCFDELWLEIRLMGQQVPALDRIIGRIIGASDFAFREMVAPDGAPPAKGIWWRPLKGRFQKTGGSQFDVALPNEAERTEMATEIQILANTIKTMEPLYDEMCKIQNEIQFKADYESLFKQLTEMIGHHFPENDGWIVKNLVTTFSKHEHIAVFKSAWCRKGMPLGQIAFAVGADSDFFENIYYAVIKLSPDKEFPLNASEVLAHTLDRSRKVQGQLLWWNYGDAKERSSGGGKKALVSGAKRRELLDYYGERLKSLKEKVTLVIDKLLDIEEAVKPAVPVITGMSETSINDATNLAEQRPIPTAT